MSAVAHRQSLALPTVAPYRSTSWTAFGALMLRDLTVLRENFVFTYVFPQIGQGVGGSKGEAQFASILVAGVIAIACIFQGI
jgi:ABC-2 type transport system permease protein